MTTFQDPPPHSRRAVRQSERGETAAATPAEGTPYSFDAAAGEAPPSQVPVTPPSGRRAQLPASTPLTGQQVPGQQVPGQHVPGQQLPGFEPLTYSTQGRIPPRGDDESYQQHTAPVPPPVSASAEGDQSAFRVRDYSPEGGRRVAPPRHPLDSPLAASSSYPGAPVTNPVDLDYHTQAAASVRAEVTPPAHVAAPPSGSLDDNQGHTLTRRELREMRAAAEQQAPPLQLPDPIGTLLNSGPIDIPTLAPPPGQSQALAEAMAEFDMLTRARREAEARARDAQVASLATPIILPQQPQSPVEQAPVQQTPVQQTPVQQTPVQQTSVQPQQTPGAEPFVQQHSAPQPAAAPAPVAVAPVASAPVASIPVASVPAPPSTWPLAEAPVADTPVPSVPLNSEPLNSEPLSSAPLSSVPLNSVPLNSVPVPTGAVQPSAVASVPEFESPGVLAPPVFSDSGSTPGSDFDDHGGRSPRASNHWRVQAAKEDEGLPFENTLSRTVGSNTSAITTSALVLPSVPQPDGILTSLTSTGEILVTGSINLPRSLGSTGAHPDRVDHADDEDDPLDSQVSAPDSAPVRAIRAVSTNTSTRGVIETKRPQGNRLLTGVIIAASVLCVGLVGLLVYAFATGKL